jgi:hypothetical protein
MLQHSSSARLALLGTRQKYSVLNLFVALASRRRSSPEAIVNEMEI